MRAKRAKICNFYIKFDTKVEKRGSLGVDWIKKGVVGCRIDVKKGGLLTGTWYPPTYGSATPGLGYIELCFKRKFMERIICVLRSLCLFHVSSWKTRPSVRWGWGTRRFLTLVYHRTFNSYPHADLLPFGWNGCDSIYLINQIHC